MRSLPVHQRSAHAAFIHCVILSLCQLLKLNDDDEMMINWQNAIVQGQWLSQELNIYYSILKVYQEVCC